jgi:hypothetical protein
MPQYLFLLPPSQMVGFPAPTAPKRAVIREPMLEAFDKIVLIRSSVDLVMMRRSFSAGAYLATWMTEGGSKFEKHVLSPSLHMPL